MPDTTRPSARPGRPSFGVMTAPSQVGYDDLVRVWREADEVPEIEHAWLFDHLMPIWGDPEGPTFEGWTLLAALAAQTRRLRLGVMVTSNRFRPPALLAKIATTVDVVSGGRLDFGIGVGSRPSPPEAWREYPAHGLPFHEPAQAVASLAEACVLIKRLWTEEKPFDFHGEHHRLTGAFGSPKPVQRPHPPILVGGRSSATLRVAAAHADLWNVPEATSTTWCGAVPCWTGTAPTSAATPRRSSGRSTSRSTPAGPTPYGTPSGRRWRQGSGTSSSGCRGRSPKASPGGWRRR